MVVAAMAMPVVVPGVIVVVVTGVTPVIMPGVVIVTVAGVVVTVGRASSSG